jgi:hypothetical protein
MKKILIQYLYIFIITLVMLSVFITVNACEIEEVDTKDLPICEEYQVTTEEKPCKKDDVSMSTIGEALEKLGESGTLPR